MLIDGWKCEELYPGTDWAMRTAKMGRNEIEADHDGIVVMESYSGYYGASGSVHIPANVITWLIQAVR
jgi:hypothetical protein